MALNRTNATAIAKVAGTETDAWRGLKITTMALPTVFQGKETMAVRIVNIERVAPAPQVTVQQYQVNPAPAKNVGVVKVEEPVKVPFQASEIVTDPNDAELNFFNTLLKQG
jgi:hypothetical protein